MRLDRVLLLAAVLVLPANFANADVTPHPLFTNNMVLQQGVEVPVWGKADPDEEVTVALAQGEVEVVTKTKADKDGKWSVKFSKLKAGTGYVLSVASMAGIMPAPYQAGYAGTKAFLLNWSESFREEVRSRGIRVTALCPGITDTEFFEAAGYRGANKFTSSKMPADRVAKAGLRALACDRPRVVPGVVNKILIFAGTRLSPRSLVQFVARKLMARRPPPSRRSSDA